MTLIEAARQALEALESRGVSMYTDDTVAEDAITNLRTAISEAEKQEPVAWVSRSDNGDINKFRTSFFSGAEPLYGQPDNGKEIGTVVIARIGADRREVIWHTPKAKCPPIGTRLYTHPAPAVPEDQLRAAFNQGLEAGAKACLEAPIKTARQDTREVCANAIRALKEKS